MLNISIKINEMNYTDFLTDRPVTYQDMQLEQLRQKYAGMAMQAIISNSKYYDECISLADEPNSGFTEPCEVVAEEAVHFAGRLIEALYPEQYHEQIEQIDNIV